MVPGTGFEPVIFAVRGRCPKPLDEPGTRFDAMHYPVARGLFAEGGDGEF